MVANPTTPATHTTLAGKPGALEVAGAGCRMSAQKKSEPGAALIPKITTCLWGVLALSACSAQEPVVPSDWKKDCVGRMQLRVPGLADVAANSFKMLAAEYNVRTLQPRFEFADGQQAGYSRQYYIGRFFVSHSLRPDERKALLKAAGDGEQRAKTYAAKEKTDGYGKPLIFERFDVSPKQGTAYTVNGDMVMTIALDQTVVRAVSNDRQGDVQKVRSDFAIKSLGLALRPLGELPKAPGVCFPYAFIKDDGQQDRSIGITYRLQDHPDVTIWLEDSSASAPMPEQDPDKFTADYRTNFFWTQRYQDRTTLKLLSRKTTDNLMDGRKGVATVVELVRKDGITTDYGYLAVVRGDPEAKQDTPDLMLYVIRDAKNATDKGKQPMDKDELIKMAQTIAASVRHRPTQ